MKRWTARIASGFIALSLVTAGCGGVQQRTVPAAEVPEPARHAPRERFDYPPRIYTANEISNTISVVDPAQGLVVDTIVLGEEITGVTRPLYNGFSDIHGLLHSPDGRFLLATARATSTVVKIDVATNHVTGYFNVGREPHAIAITADSSEAWVTVRGAAYISVLDVTGDQPREIEQIPVMNGPGMVWFSPDQRYAFVTSQKEDTFMVIKTSNRKVVQTLHLPGRFSPFEMTTPDGQQLWVIHKDVNKVSVIAIADDDAVTLQASFDVGNRPNHVAFVGTRAFVSLGAGNAVEVYDRSGGQPQLIKSLATGTEAHGIWPNADGSLVYVDHEKSNDIAVIDTATLEVVGRIPVGKKPIDLVYKP